MKTIHDFYKYKEEKTPISMITAYDFWSAKIVNQSSIDCILVGDSVAMVAHGFENTIHADMELMSLHTKMVSRGAPNKFIISDMPFLSFHQNQDSVINNVDQLMKSGAQAIKIEGAQHNTVKFIDFIVQSGVPVMGHLGLTPQSVHQLGGFKVQGKTKEAQNTLLEQAKQLEEAGCFSLVLECIPQNLAKEITESLSIPTVGIGAGSNTDGQVLVMQDLLGMNPDFQPKFVRQYLNGHQMFLEAFQQFNQSVKERTFPKEKEWYS